MGDGGLDIYQVGCLIDTLGLLMEEYRHNAHCMRNQQGDEYII